MVLETPESVCSDKQHLLKAILLQEAFEVVREVHTILNNKPPFHTVTPLLNHHRLLNTKASKAMPCHGCLGTPTLHDCFSDIVRLALTARIAWTLPP